MKQPLHLFLALLTLLFVGCSYDDTAILDRIENLENNQKTEIATLQQQIEAINNSIAALEAAKVSLDERITNAQADADANADDIAKLQDAKTTIEQRITTLQTYVDTELQKAKDWATATFATLEQYNSLAGDMATLQSVVDGLDKVLKNWVNEQLDGYYTIAEVDAALEALQNSIDESSEALQKDIDELSTKVDNMKAELTDAYTTAIEEAINTNNGVIDGKIAEEIAAVNGRIDSEVAAINARISALEERIEDLEEALDKIKALDIVFDIESGKACMAGTSIEFGYTIVGGDEDTEVESFGDRGWGADVIATDATSGRIRVTAPKDGGNGKVIVLATSGAGASTMKSIRFEEGILTDIADRYEVDWEACTLAVRLKTNVDYEVRIPAEAQSWLSVADTRAEVREDTLTFSVAENPEDSPERTAVIELVSEFGEVLQSFEIVQKIQPSSNPIQFADPYVKKVCVEKFDTNGDGELSYKEASKVTYIESNFFGDYATIVTSFDELQYFSNVKSIYRAFEDCYSLKSLAMPNSVTNIEGYTFCECQGLKHIILSDQLKEIGSYAFGWCKGLEQVVLPDSVEFIDDGAFFSCENLSEIYLGKNLVHIGKEAFLACGFEEITLPEKVSFIGSSAFQCCKNLKRFNGKFAKDNGQCLVCNDILVSYATASESEYYTIPNNVLIIGTHAFYEAMNLKYIIIPEGVLSIGLRAFEDCANLKSVSISSTVTTIGSCAFEDCQKLEQLYCKSPVPPVISELFYYWHPTESFTIYVPTEFLEDYQNSYGWADLTDHIVGYDFDNGVVVE